MLLNIRLVSIDAFNLDDDKEDKKWLVDQLSLILDILVNEVRAYGEIVSASSDYVSDSFDFLRNELLTGIGFLVTISFAFASLKVLSVPSLELIIVTLIVAGLFVYFLSNYLRNVTEQLFEAIERAYDDGANRLDFFRGHFLATTLHVDKFSLEQLYLVESFIKVLLGEVGGTIRSSFQPLLQFSYAPRSEGLLASNVNSLDLMIENGYKTYTSNKTTYQESSELLGASLLAAEQFAAWYVEKYPDLKKAIRKR